jgi:hypothetical protein
VHHVSVLTMGPPEDRDPLNPRLVPWLAYTQALPFPVEWTAILDVYDGPAMKAMADRARRRNESIEEHHAEHGERPGKTIQVGIEDARRIDDEVNDGSREVACRLIGPIRCAVWGDTPDEAISNAATLTDAYRRDQRIPLVHPYGQFELYKEFMLCAAPERNGHQRQMPAYFLATALPNVSTNLGDGVGPTWGSSPAARTAPSCSTRSTARRTTSPASCSASPTSAAASQSRSAARSPSRPPAAATAPSSSTRPGRWPALTQLPHLRRDARHIELDGAQPGTLIPVPDDPRPAPGRPHLGPRLPGRVR